MRSKFDKLTAMIVLASQHRGKVTAIMPNRAEDKESGLGEPFFTITFANEQDLNAFEFAHQMYEVPVKFDVVVAHKETSECVADFYVR